MLLDLGGPQKPISAPHRKQFDTVWQSSGFGCWRRSSVRRGMLTGDGRGWNGPLFVGFSAVGGLPVQRAARDVDVTVDGAPAAKGRFCVLPPGGSPRGGAPVTRTDCRHADAGGDRGRGSTGRRCAAHIPPPSFLVRRESFRTPAPAAPWLRVAHRRRRRVRSAAEQWASDICPASVPSECGPGRRALRRRRGCDFVTAPEARRCTRRIARPRLESNTCGAPVFAPLSSRSRLLLLAQIRPAGACPLRRRNGYGAV